MSFLFYPGTYRDIVAPWGGPGEQVAATYEESPALTHLTQGWQNQSYVDAIKPLLMPDNPDQAYESSVKQIMNDYLRRGLAPQDADRWARRALSPTYSGYRGAYDTLFGAGGLLDNAQNTSFSNTMTNSQLDQWVNPMNQAANDFASKYAGTGLADMLAQAAAGNVMTPKQLAQLRAQRGAGTPLPAAPGQQYSTVFPQAQTSSSFSGRIKENV